MRRRLDRGLSEQRWQALVERELTLFGWWWMHIPSNVVVCFRCGAKNYRGIRKGFPDVLAIKPPHILWLELKTEQGRLKPEQTQVGQMLLACGQTWIHAKPHDRDRVLELIRAA